jgi:cytochrome c-type biogenesis protein
MAWGYKLDMLLAIGTALWFGILTSISPCPLATNIAAISFISKRLDSTFHIVAAGLVYTLGRMAAYIVVGVVIVAGLMSVPSVANFLQKYLNLLLGPILIIVGMFLLELITINVAGRGLTNGMQSRVEKGGIIGAGFLGLIFGLSFCPISAALFFGSLIPLAIEQESRFLLPAIYGIGTALPVVVFAFIIAFSTHSIGKAFNALRGLEKWARIITGILFILLGIYYVLVRIFNLNFTG